MPSQKGALSAGGAENFGDSGLLGYKDLSGERGLACRAKNELGDTHELLYALCCRCRRTGFGGLF